jgi:LemA protein
MKKGWVVALTIVGVIVLSVAVVALSVMNSYNKFVNLNEQVTNQWKQVDVQLVRRSDLIPNLVSTVKGYAAHEKEIFEKLADARARMAGAKTPAESIDAANQMTSALSRLLVVVENYPNLKADQTFLRLMDELSGTENRIAVERRRYNDLVMQYNAMRKRFPTNFIAAMFNFQEAAYFGAPESAREAPKVEFGK